LRVVHHVDADRAVFVEFVAHLVEFGGQLDAGRAAADDHDLPCVVILHSPSSLVAPA